MRSKLLWIAFMLISSFCYSQNIEVSGKVNESATGLPIPGANVSVKNSNIGTVTDLDGNFSLSVPQGSTLVFSFIGFQTVERAAEANMTISLSEDAQTLDEVVVIGYGTQRRREVTGAVSVVTSETIEETRPVRIEQALQGTVTGVNVQSTGGAPGAGLNIRIRGIASNGENDPLVIIDGYIAPENSYSHLNFNDIESLTVLKDAQAAIYGTAAANGVILITTKKGRKNQPLSFSYNTYLGLQETSRKLPLLNATEYALLLNESYANDGRPIPFPNPTALGAGTDWQDQLFNQGVPIVEHDIAASGGSETVSYNISASHLGQDGLIGGDKSHYDRNTLRLAMNADLLKNLKLSYNIMYTDYNRQSFNDFALGSVLFNALNTPSIYSPYDETGAFTVLPVGDPSIPGSNLGIEIINPLAQLANTYNDYDNRNIQGNISLDWNIYKDLTLTTRMGVTSSDGKSRSFSPRVDYGGTKVFNNVRSSVTENHETNYQYTFDAYLTYKKTLAEAHNITGTLGMTAWKNWGDFLSATGFDVPNNSWQFANVGSATGIPTGPAGGSYSYEDTRLSHFVRAQYDYKGRYLVSGMLRRDTSSRFGSTYRVAYFPSVTGGWIISDEPFYGESKFLNFAKLRASYGVLGSDNINSNVFRPLLGGEATYVFDGQLVNGAAMGVISNPDVLWEKTKKFDLGTDLRFFNDKVEIVADYYSDVRHGLLIPFLPVSLISGGGAPGSGFPTVNAGTVRNRGLEFSIGYKDKIGEDFNFNINYNVTFIDNEVTAINGNAVLEGGAYGVGQPAATRMEVGHSLGYFYGYETDGIFQTQAEVDAHPSQVALGAEAKPGDIRFKDLNSDGVLNNLDRTDIGDPIPDAIMGFNVQFNYKGLDFVAYTYASLGNDMVRNYERTQTDVNRLNYVLDRWTGPGTSNTVPRVTTGATANNVLSDYFVEDASFLRIQNVQLGYTINPDFTKKAGINKLRVYAGVNNLYTFTKYKGYDPAASTGAPLGSGIDYGFYPIPRTYMFGLNVNF